MKRSLKLIAGVCAIVMLLSTGLATAVSAADTSSSQAASYADYALELYILNNLGNCTLLSNGDYRLPNGITITAAQYYNIWSKYYWYTGSNSIVPPTTNIPTIPSTPSRPNVLTSTINLDLYESTYIGYYGTGYTYSSTSPSVVYVDMYGRITAVAPGTAYITVDNGSYTFQIVTVNVATPTAESEADLGVKITIDDRYLHVGETTSFSATVTIKGYTVSGTNYTLDYSLSNSDVLSMDTDKMTLTALKEGSADLVVSINGTKVTASVIVYVDNNNYYNPTIPDYLYPPTYLPNYWYPSLPEYNLPVLNWWSSLNSSNGWVVTQPGQGVVDGLFAGILSGIIGEELKDLWNIDFNYDPDKYTISYKVVYYDGNFYRVPIFVEKDADDTTDTDSKDDNLPDGPSVLTPEELEALIEAERLAALNKAIEQAIAGKIDWYEVYPDVLGDNIYAAGVKYVLDTQLLPGKDDGVFGTKDEITFGDVEKFLCTYLDISEEELAKKNILPNEDKDAVISREEITLVFYNLAKELKMDLSASKNLSGLKDYQDLDAAYRDSYSWATASKLMINTSTKMDPDGALTKEMLSLIIYRFDKLVK